MLFKAMWVSAMQGYVCLGAAGCRDGTPVDKHMVGREQAPPFGAHLTVLISISLMIINAEYLFILFSHLFVLEEVSVHKILPVLYILHVIPLSDE